MKDQAAWILGILFGLFGILISAGLFAFIALETGMIFGMVAILCGGISGGAVGLGYKIGKGKLKSKKEVNTFLSVITLFGLFGIIIAYLGPYWVFASKLLSFSMYMSLIDFNLMDLMFMFIGAYGGRWVGARIARSILLNEAYRQYMEKAKDKTTNQIDNKLKLKSDSPAKRKGNKTR